MKAYLQLGINHDSPEHQGRVYGSRSTTHGGGPSSIADAAIYRTL